MPINFKPIVVYDYETDGIDPYTCSPVQLGACVIHSRKLFRIPNMEFNSLMRPEGIDEPNYIDDHIKTIKWHADLKNTSIDAIVETWKNAPGPKKVWEDFMDFLKKQHSNPAKMSGYTAPIRAGHNIANFDDIITTRLAEKYGTKCIFSPINKLDLLDLLFVWFENTGDVEKLSLDYLRDYFGMSKENAHDALQDVKDTADILIKLLNLHRHILPKVKFKGSFN